MALVVTALVTGVLMRGSFGHDIIVGIGVTVVLLVLLALLVSLLLTIRRNGRTRAILMSATKITVIVGGALILSVGIGKGIHHWEMYRAKSFVDSAVPKLDSYFAQHGTYPLELRELGIESPRWFSPEVVYSSDGSGFQFVYWDDAAIMDGHLFQDPSRTWMRFD